MQARAKPRGLTRTLATAILAFAGCEIVIPVLDNPYPATMPSFGVRRAVENEKRSSESVPATVL